MARPSELQWQSEHETSRKGAEMLSLLSDQCYDRNASFITETTEIWHGHLQAYQLLIRV